MAVSANQISEIVEFIRNREDFVTSEQLYEKFGVFSTAYKSNPEFVDFYQDKNFNTVFQDNKILMFIFRPQARFFDPESDDFDPEWAYGLEGDPNYDKVYLISASKYQQFIEGMLELFLMGNDYESVFSETESYLNSTLVQMLALGDATDIYNVKLLDTSSLSYIINASSQFEIVIENKYASISKSKIVLSSGYSKSAKHINLIHSVVRSFNRLKVKSLRIDKLCLALSMDPDFNAISKPVKVDELLPILLTLPRFNIIETTVQMLEIDELLSKLDSELFSEFERIPKSHLGSVLLVFRFIGDNFPLDEAREYVELRSIIYMSIDPDFTVEKLNNIQVHYPELAEVLGSLIEDSDIDLWVKENTRFAFIHDDLQKLRANFDSLLKEFSPIFNLRKNPGNLFRGIIEERIREVNN